MENIVVLQIQFLKALTINKPSVLFPTPRKSFVEQSNVVLQSTLKEDETKDSPVRIFRRYRRDRNLPAELFSHYLSFDVHKATSMKKGAVHNVLRLLCIEKHIRCCGIVFFSVLHVFVILTTAEKLATGAYVWDTMGEACTHSVTKPVYSKTKLDTTRHPS